MQLNGAKFVEDAAEDAVNKYRDQLRSNHLNDLKLGVYNYQIGNAYSGIYALYEKLGDHIINISEAIDPRRKRLDE